ncbi:secreted RxLR effector protein 161-like [Apium graveolens]|uniref:secreted RxLR effector protein 161-like n=1 Tax=Apium graveolens TaxID=4045 RepID=UPI003D7B18EE
MLSQIKYTKEILALAGIDFTRTALTHLPIDLKLTASGDDLLGNIKLYRSLVDWASCPDSRRSITVYILLKGNSPVTWKTKKQTIASKSSSEAEYRAMVSTASEVVWFVRLSKELGIHHLKPIQLHYDN